MASSEISSGQRMVSAAGDLSIVKLLPSMPKLLETMNTNQESPSEEAAKSTKSSAHGNRNLISGKWAQKD